MRIRAPLLVPVLVSLAVVACRSENGGAPDATGGGPPIERAAALEALVKANCQHLYSCGAIAGGEKYDTLDACRLEERRALETDVECANLASSKLNACVTALADKKCDPLVKNTPAACKDLCAR